MFSYVLVVIMCVLRHLLTFRRPWLSNYDAISFDCQQEALVPDYVHLSTALLPNPFQLQELTATAFFQYTMDI